MVYLSFVFLLPIVFSQQKKKVKVGIAAVEKVLPSFIGFSRSGGAIGIAMDRMQMEGVSSGIEFEFYVNYTECNADTAVTVAIELMKKNNVDVVIAPPCLAPATVMAHLSTFYRKPLLGWGFLTNSDLSHPDIYPYVTKLTPDSFTKQSGIPENDVQFTDQMLRAKKSVRSSDSDEPQSLLQLATINKDDRWSV
ncbi:hypothetical protein KIN20_014418 [Parelaphostrongylus tenuis]|uniref:Receptor ligand binding region domain-containing protein n=1 Tax=Parelaphostrongylus tenuis TaxID=148309 RepID=A0AAD5QPA7_PARTN|nr:hypothetical protein KIN20_014418 [Parelaphostrongylus tenuis]